MSQSSLKLFFGLFVATALLLSLVNCQADLENSENSDDLETAEFFIWPKLFLAKAALGKAALGGLAFSKTVQINTAPAPVVKYSYKPVTYTAYKWVPVPYQYTVQKPYIDTSSSSATLTTSTSTQAESKPISAPFASGNLAVRAPFVNVDVVKTAGTYSVNTDVGAAGGTPLVAVSTSGSSPSTSSTKDEDENSAF